MTTNLYNSASVLIGEVDVKSIIPTGAATYMTGSLRNDGMTEWFDASKLADGRRCGTMYLFSAAEMASEANETEWLIWSASHIDRVILDIDEDDFAPTMAEAEAGQ